jgi:tripartite-type tricarboxylate transporter receptor subunit TctC
MSDFHDVRRSDAGPIRVALLSAAVVTSLAAVAPAHSQNYPARPVTMMVPYSPGGGADIVGRIIAPRLAAALQGQIVVDNRAGSSGNIGAAMVAKAPADGYTLLLATTTHAVNASLYQKLTYDFGRDFSGVGMLSNFPYVLVVHPSLPVNDVKGLVALAKKKPGELMHSSSGNGSSPHLTAEVFKLETGVKMIHVPYKGAPEALTDLVGGRVQIGFASISSVLPLVKQKRLRALGVTSATRPKAAADLPTLAELGYKDVVVGTWNAVVVPAKTPPAIIARLNAEIAKAVNDPEVTERFSAIGVEPATSTPQELDAFVKDEIQRWAKVIKSSGMTVD